MSAAKLENPAIQGIIGEAGVTFKAVQSRRLLCNLVPASSNSISDYRLLWGKICCDNADMASTYRFIADPSSPQPVVEWLRALPVPPEEVPTESGIVFYFRACGSLSYAADKTVVAEESPVATLFLPRVERGVLWTVGELHFRTTRLRERFPDLAKIQVSFSKWLRSHTCVCSDDASDNEFRYFLEGSVQNYPPVYAFPSGVAALQAGTYLVGDGDNEHVLERLCRTLRLRGVSCVEG